MAQEQVVSHEKFQWICTSETSQELEGKYDRWAEAYEADIVDFWHTVPTTAAKLLARYIPEPEALILDLGAGTGMVGVALAELGFTNLSGSDISQKMLDQAAEKQVYRELQHCPLAAIAPDLLAQAAGMLAIGVFAEAQAGAEELKLIQTHAQPDSITVFTSRQSFLPQLQPVLESADWTLLDSQILPIYEDPMHLMAYRLKATA